jgi:para-nitrobenzyl esterase
MTEPELKTLLAAGYGAKADALLALYREHFPTKSPYLLYAQIVTDAGFRRFAHAQAECKADGLGAPVYAYLWEWISPGYGGKFGAAHAMDVSASFHNERDAILGGGSQDALRMCGALATTWVTFAKTGDPNNALPLTAALRSGTARNPALDRETRVVAILTAHPSILVDMPAPTSVLG